MPHDRICSLDTATSMYSNTLVHVTFHNYFFVLLLVYVFFFVRFIRVTEQLLFVMLVLTRLRSQYTDKRKHWQLSCLGVPR